MKFLKKLLSRLNYVGYIENLKLRIKNLKEENELMRGNILGSFLVTDVSQRLQVIRDEIKEIHVRVNRDVYWIRQDNCKDSNELNKKMDNLYQIMDGTVNDALRVIRFHQQDNFKDLNKKLDKIIALQPQEPKSTLPPSGLGSPLHPLQRDEVGKKVYDSIYSYLRNTYYTLDVDCIVISDLKHINLDPKSPGYFGNFYRVGPKTISAVRKLLKKYNIQTV